MEIKMDLQQEGDLGISVELQLVGSELGQDVFVDGEFVPCSRCVVKCNAVATPANLMTAGRRFEMSREEVAMTPLAEDHVIPLLGWILRNLQ